MSAYYVTYRQHGILKRAVLSQSLYEKYSKDSSITDLQFFPNQQLMESAFNESKGVHVNFKKLLHD